MKILFEASFARDLKRIKNKTVLQQVQQIINQVKAAQTLNDIHSMKKMQGYETLYYIRLGDYRIGIEIVREDIIFVRILNRKDIYRYFP